MELTKQPLMFEGAPLRIDTRAAAEGTLTPPPSLPPMEKVLCVDGYASASAKAAEGKLRIDGTVLFHVLYVCSAGKTHGFESAAVFAHAVDLPGAKADMRAFVHCALGKIRWRLTGGSVELSAEVQLSCFAAGKESLAVLSGADVQGLETRCETLSLWQSEISSEELGLRDEVRLPRTADRLLSLSGWCRIQNALPEGEKVSLSGMLKLCALFAAPDGTVVQAPFSLPFETRLPLPEGAKTAFAAARLLALSGTLVDEDILSVEARAEATVAALKEETHTVLTDAYAVGHSLSHSAAAFTARKELWCNCRGTLRLEAPLPEGMPDAERVLAVRLRPAADSCAAAAGALELSGTVYASILYLCREGNLHSFEAALPFSCGCETPALQAGMEVFADLACELLHAGAATGSILIQCALDCAVQAYALADHSALTDAAAGEPLGGLYGPVVYFPAEGETLWEVGKRFCVPLSELKSLNPDLEKELPPALVLNLRRPRPL